MISDHIDDGSTTTHPQRETISGAPMDTLHCEANPIEHKDVKTQIMAAAATTPSNVTSAWANIPPPEDQNSVYSEPPHSYEVPIHDPENIDPSTKRGNHSAGSRRIRSAAASSSSRKDKNSINNSSRVSHPSTTFNDNDSTVAACGGSENVWNTTLNTPRTDLSIQERLTNTAISGTIELLKQVGGVTVSATGALVAPPLHITRTVLLPSLFAAFKDFISSNSPVRLKDWFRIFSTSIYHIFNTLQNTEAGHVFSNRMVLIMVDLIDCISAETTRQLLLDGMSCFVKFFEIIHTPIFQSYCEQLTTTGCRMIDALSNGRNKLLLHDVQKAVICAGELLADPATTVALAEVTAHLCYALEMEDQQIQIDEHKRSSPTPTEKSTTGTGGPRRQERDTYQIATVLKRDTLDNGHTVEEAILSSLGVENNHSTDCPSNTSIPVSIVLDARQPTKSSLKDVSTGSNRIKSHDGNKIFEWHEHARNDVDVQVLRDGILQRTNAIKASSLRQETKIPVDGLNNNAAFISDNSEKEIFDGSFLDLEEYGVVAKFSETSGDNYRESKLRRNKQAIEMRLSIDDDEPERNVVNKIPPDFDQNDLLSTPRKSNARKDGESANEHFYRILDEILGEKRKETANEAIADEMVRSEGIKAGVSRRFRQPKQGNPTIKDRLNTIRLEMMSNGYNSTTANQKHLSSKLDHTGKKVILIVAIVTLLIITFWFSMGCYGFYVYLNPTALISQRVLTAQATNHAQHEIIIRVIKEVVHVNSDGKEVGRGPWHQPEGGTQEHNIDYGKVADCVASLI